MEILVAKLNNKIVEIISVSKDVKFSPEKNWILISPEVGKRNSIRWVKASETKFDWVRSFIA